MPSRMTKMVFRKKNSSLIVSESEISLTESVQHSSFFKGRLHMRFRCAICLCFPSKTQWSAKLVRSLYCKTFLVEIVALSVCIAIHFLPQSSISGQGQELTIREELRKRLHSCKLNLCLKYFIKVGVNGSCKHQLITTRQQLWL